jgi:hypothetical protein
MSCSPPAPPVNHLGPVKGEFKGRESGLLVLHTLGFHHLDRRVSGMRVVAAGEGQDIQLLNWKDEERDGDGCADVFEVPALGPAWRPPLAFAALHRLRARPAVVHML